MPVGGPLIIGGGGGGGGGRPDSGGGGGGGGGGGVCIEGVEDLSSAFNRFKSIVSISLATSFGTFFFNSFKASSVHFSLVSSV